MQQSIMRTAVIALRLLWIALMAILLVLIITNAISGYAMAAYSAVVLAVLGGELLLKRRLRVTQP